MFDIDENNSHEDDNTPVSNLLDFDENSRTTTIIILTYSNTLSSSIKL